MTADPNERSGPTDWRSGRRGKADANALREEALTLARDPQYRAEVEAIREQMAELSNQDRSADHDDQGRLLPGLVPGWGMSWWWREQGLDPREAGSMTMEQRLELMDRYWRDVAEGWEPSVPRERWVGPYHPFEPADPST